MTVTIETLQTQLAEERRLRLTTELQLALDRKHGLDPDIAPLLARGEEAQAKLREGQTPEHVAAGIAATAPSKFRAKPPVDGKSLKERFERLHAEAAERRMDAVQELRRKLGVAGRAGR